jgi:hypothetical protein
VQVYLFALFAQARVLFAQARGRLPHRPLRVQVYLFAQARVLSAQVRVLFAQARVRRSLRLRCAPCSARAESG